MLATGRYKNRMYGAPLNTGSQLLWYRKDLVPNPPTTWDEMIEDGGHCSRPASAASRCRAPATRASRSGSTRCSSRRAAGSSRSRARCRSRGRRRKGAAGHARRRPTRRRLIRRSSNSRGRRRVGLPGRQGRVHGQLPVRRRGDQKGNADVFKNMGVALLPRVDPDRPAQVTLGGFNLGVAPFSNHRQPTSRPRPVPRAAREPDPLRHGRRAAADQRVPVPGPEVVKAFPYADLLLQTLQQGSTRPVSPAYNDISLAMQGTLHPPASISPSSGVSSLRSRVDDAINSRGLL